MSHLFHRQAFDPALSDHAARRMALLFRGSRAKLMIAKLNLAAKALAKPGRLGAAMRRIAAGKIARYEPGQTQRLALPRPPVGRVVAAASRQRTLVRAASGGHRGRITRIAPVIPVRVAKSVAAIATRTIVATPATKPRPSQQSSGPRLILPRTTAGVPRAVTRRFAASAGASSRRAAVPIGARLAARTAVMPAGVALHRRSTMALSALPQAAAPGQHRNIRPRQARTAPGNVYLDKTLVGYHLAAAITAEQTRAAARPNTAGAGFNTGMAALRPSGWGASL